MSGEARGVVSTFSSPGVFLATLVAVDFPQEVAGPISHGFLGEAHGVPGVELQVYVGPAGFPRRVFAPVALVGNGVEWEIARRARRSPIGQEADLGESVAEHPPRELRAVVAGLGDDGL